MGLQSIPTYATGDTIEASWANTLRDNALILDARTGGDPGSAGKIPISSGALAASWLAAGANGLVLCMVAGAPVWAEVGASGIAADSITDSELATGAAVANIGYTPVANTGGTITGVVVISGVGAGLTVSGSSGLLSNGSGGTTLSGSGPTTLGGSGGVFITDPAGVVLSGAAGLLVSSASGVTIINNLGVGGIVNAGALQVAGVAVGVRDGTLQASLNAALLNSLTSAQLLARANHTGSQLAATISDFAAAVAALTPTSAGGGNFAVAPTIGGDAIALIAQGTYSGNGATNRQITTGFPCKYVLIEGSAGGGFNIICHITSTSGGMDLHNSGGPGSGGAVIAAGTDGVLHAADGFVIGATGGTWLNIGGMSARWKAWG